MTNLGGETRTLDQYLKSRMKRVREEDLVAGAIYNAMLLRREGNPKQAVEIPVTALVQAGSKTSACVVSLCMLTSELKPRQNSSLVGAMAGGLWLPTEPEGDFSEGHIGAYDDGTGLGELDGYETSDAEAFDRAMNDLLGGAATDEFANILAVPKHALREMQHDRPAEAPLRSVPPSSTPFRDRPY